MAIFMPGGKYKHPTENSKHFQNLKTLQEFHRQVHCEGFLNFSHYYGAARRVFALLQGNNILLPY